MIQKQNPYYQFNSLYYIRILLINLIIHTLYEMKDYYKTYLNPNSVQQERLTLNNSLLNSIGDTIFFIVGFLFMIYLVKWFPVLKSSIYGVYLSILYIIIYSMVFFRIYHIFFIPLPLKLANIK